jgi:hypothetical protein
LKQPLRLSVAALLAAGFLALALAQPALAAKQADYVIAISVDGLGTKWLQPLVDGGQLPNFKRFIAQSTFTYNARNDFNITVTLPNHTAMLTSRGVLGITGSAGGDGHDWIMNEDPKPGENLHANKGSYVAGVYDVAHDNGLRTALFSTKKKFSLYQVSYDATHGAEDKTGPDNGRNKLDTFVCEPKSPDLTARFVADMKAKPFNFTLVHFGEPDAAGHDTKNGGWGSPAYNEAIKMIDGCLGAILDLAEKDPVLKGRTVILLTADHGGHEFNHNIPTDPYNYTIPFGVWGAGVKSGTDLYALNLKTRQDPGELRPEYKAAVQPIRNSEVGNAALEFLGLPAIPGSTINTRQDLNVGAVAVAVPAAAGLSGLAVLALAARRRRAA